MEENSVEKMPKRFPARSPVTSVDIDKRKMEIVVCTADCDRQGDIVEPAGLNFENFLKNPVVLWAHDLNRPPVGKVVEVISDKDQVSAVIEFAETDFAKELFRLYADGYLNAWSFGFIPKRWKKLPKTDGGGFHVIEAEVIEVSAVPVPANAQALTKALEEIQDPQLSSSLEEDAKDLPQEYTELFEEFVNRLMVMIESQIEIECQQ